MRLVLLVAVLLLLLPMLCACSPQSVRVTCLDGGKVVFDQTVLRDSFATCYRDRYGYCVNVPKTGCAENSEVN